MQDNVLNKNPMNAGICMGDRPVVAWTVVIKPSMIPNSS
jgi:hypothetical protein